MTLRHAPWREQRRWWEGRRVLLTGQSGFKGAWLARWLTELGAQVTGLALPPDHADGAFHAFGLQSLMVNHWVDLRDEAEVRRVIADSSPEVVLHLAAQALVSRAYSDPLATLDVNVRGTATVLDACRGLPRLRAVIVVTTDKVYANAERGDAFREDAPLGGGDPYSASKAACELVVESWRHSFGDALPPLATARAGNVIGGGDTSADRLVPDVFRALDRGEPVRLRHPEAVRPWQFVLEPIAGYLLLAQALATGATGLPGALNFGPDPASTRPVGEVVDLVLARWGTGTWQRTEERPGREAGVLRLDASQATELLGWAPRLSIHEAIEWTVDWHRHPADRGAVGLEQLRRYEELLP